MGWFIYFIYKYVTTQIKKKLGEMHTVLIALIDRVRMLDNDIIRLRSKVNTVLELREKREKDHQKREIHKSILINKYDNTRILKNSVSILCLMPFLDTYFMQVN